MDNCYGGVIWTNHALQRLTERGIKQGDAWATFSHPEESRYAQTKGAWIFYRTYGANKIEVVATQDKEKKWIIFSVWSKPSQTRSKQSQPRSKQVSHDPRPSSQNYGFLENQVEKVLQRFLGSFRKTK